MLHYLVKFEADILSTSLSSRIGFGTSSTGDIDNRLQACIAADGGYFKHALLTLCTFAEMQLIDIRRTHDDLKSFVA